VSTLIHVIHCKCSHVHSDFICNWLGNKAWTEALEWPGKKAYNAAPYTDLVSHIDGNTTGSVKSASNLTYIRLAAGGHMVRQSIYDNTAQH
jgi:cathepsin A (carboxypeptidase C)